MPSQNAPSPTQAVAPVARDLLLLEVERFSRGPFRDILVDILSAKPDKKSLQAFANKYPDRWAQALTIVARLSGYAEKKEETKNINVMIHSMSDAELLAELGKKEGSKDLTLTPYDVTHAPPKADY